MQCGVEVATCMCTHHGYATHSIHTMTRPVSEQWKMKVSQKCTVVPFLEGEYSNIDLKQ